MTQNEKIMRHLAEVGEIDALTALKEYGIMRLASRISDLRKMGVPIIAERVTAKNRFDEKVSYSKYRIEKEKENVR